MINSNADTKTAKVLTGMIVFTASLAGLSVLFFVLYNHYFSEWLFSVAVTMLTVFYHFAMRLIVGETVSYIYRNKDFPQDTFGFRFRSFESELYKKWKVKQWKNNVITAKPELFNIKKLSPEELLHNVMQAELVHRIIMILSFVPVLFIIPFGVPAVFIITSVVACLVDFRYVIIQRYNRPRIIRYIKHLNKQNEKA